MGDPFFIYINHNNHSMKTFFYSQVTWIATILTLFSYCHYKLDNPAMALPKLIGVYTPMDILWLNTETFEISSEAGDVLFEGATRIGNHYQPGTLTTLKQALDTLEDLSAEYVIMYDEIGIKGAFTMDNPFKGTVAVYIWNEDNRCRQRIGELSHINQIDTTYTREDGTYSEITIWTFTRDKKVTLPNGKLLHSFSSPNTNYQL